MAPYPAPCSPPRRWDKGSAGFESGPLTGLPGGSVKRSWVILFCTFVLMFFYWGPSHLAEHKPGTLLKEHLASILGTQNSPREAWPHAVVGWESQYSVLLLMTRIRTNREREIDIHTYTHTYIYIYVYTYYATTIPRFLVCKVMFFLNISCIYAVPEQNPWFVSWGDFWNSQET